MILLLTFIFGFSAAFIGLIPPSMLNMTTVKISANKGKNIANKFAIGVSVTVFFQAILALLITKMLKENQYLLSYIKEVAALIFLILSVYFFKMGYSDKKANYSRKQRVKNNFLMGVLLSFLNMFAIPYYCGVSSALDMAGYLKFDNYSIFSFVSGATLGTFFILHLYGYAAQKVLKRIHILTNNINFILGGITGLLAIITIIQIF